MFAQYFGQYLLNHGLVNAEELAQAIEAEKETRVKLGVLAINRGYMTSEQVEEVHQAQTRMDKRFGEIAVELGYITDEQVSELLSSQHTAHLTLGQALIDRGIMNYNAFASALNQYKQEFSLSDEQFAEIVSGNIETLLETMLLRGELGGHQAWTDYIQLFAKNLIRFIDADIRLEQGAVDAFSACDWIVQQPILSGDGATSRITAIGGSESAMLALASLYAQEPVEEPGELMEACIGEFLNLHNGIYLVNVSNAGTELELHPQSVIRGSAFKPDSPFAAAVRIVGASFEFYLFFTDLDDLK